MDRKAIKAKGKEVFKANYWPCVGAGFLMSIAIGGAATVTSRSASSSSAEAQAEMQSAIAGIDPAVLTTIVLAVLSAIMLVSLIAALVKIFVLSPLEIGCDSFFRKNLAAPMTTGEAGSGFKNNYGKNVGTMFLKDVYIFLWSLLCVIPGIIKTYSYRMVPFIRAEHPELSANEVITKSREMMNGHKWEAFVFDLSFLGWFIVAGLTVGIAGIFYVYPYFFSSCANYYEAVKAESGNTVA